MEFLMSAQVLLVGGSGVVGQQLATLLAQRHPDVHLLIGGRSRARAQSLADALPNASSITLDTAADDPLAQLTTYPQLVVALVNDTDDHLLSACLRRSIPYLDITRWTERLQRTLARLPMLPAAPVPIVFASSWMASVAATLARGQAEDIVDSAINIDILYAMNDKAGPDSTEYMDRLAVPFHVIHQGRPVVKKAFTDSLAVAFTGAGRVRTYRFDAPDQMTLPMLSGVTSVSTRLAFDSAMATGMLMLIVRSGLWWAISGPRFTKLRRSLLYNPGSGGSHQIRISVSGQDRDGVQVQSSLEIDDPQGQTHLTAVGAFVQVQRILGLGGHAPAPIGPQYAETWTDPALMRNTLKEFGVRIR